MILIPLLMGLVFQETPQEVYRFDVEVRTVFVNVFVSRDGRPITDLTANNFEILDQGERQDLELVDPQTFFSSALLILDTSSSVSGPKLEHLRAAAHSFVRGLKEKDQAGLMIFNHYCLLRQEMGRDFASLHDALDRPVQGGFTGLHDALYAGLKLVGQSNGRPMVVLFTDGDDTASWLTEQELLDVAKESEAIVHIIGIRSSEQLSPKDAPGKQLASRIDDFLNNVARTTGGRVWYADSSANLEDVFLKVLEEMETRYLLSYQLQGSPEPGWHELEVKVKRRNGTSIRARPGYMVFPVQN